MRYAILSDIHGNLRALDAALKDAEAQRIDCYLFLGDYFADFPFPNEVADRIRSMPNAYAVRGNKEDFLIELSRQDQSTWVYDQIAGLHWNFRTFTPENLAYYMNMPQMLTVDSPAGPIVLMHVSGQLFRDTALGKMRSSSYAKRANDPSFDREVYLREMLPILRADEELRARIEKQEGKIFLFGHNHLQWHAQVHGAYFINPGSCGIPFDGDTRPAYAIMEITGRGQIIVEERRVAYNIERAKAELRASPVYEIAPVWYNVVLMQAETGIEYVYRLFAIAQQIADAAGKPNQPFTNEIWAEAGRQWREQCDREER